MTYDTDLLLTRDLVLATVPPINRRVIVPACIVLPGVFKKAVHALAR